MFKVGLDEEGNILPADPEKVEARIERMIERKRAQLSSSQVETQGSLPDQSTD